MLFCLCFSERLFALWISIPFTSAWYNMEKVRHYMNSHRYFLPPSQWMYGFIPLWNGIFKEVLALIFLKIWFYWHLFCSRKQFWFLRNKDFLYVFQIFKFWRILGFSQFCKMLLIREVWYSSWPIYSLMMRNISREKKCVDYFILSLSWTFQFSIYLNDKSTVSEKHPQLSNFHL